jgi:ankyrin repeat protein
LYLDSGKIIIPESFVSNKIILFFYSLFILTAHGMELEPAAIDPKSLHHAIDEKDHVLVEYLCKQGVNVHQKDFLGKTPLLRSVEKGLTDIFFTLAKSGAHMDVHIPDFFGSYPICKAIPHNEPLNRPIISKLLQLGAKPNREFIFTGWYPLHALLLRKEDADTYEVLIELLEHGADPNVTDPLGNTPLDYAKKYDRSEKIISLLSKVTIVEKWLVPWPPETNPTPKKKYGCPFPCVVL